MADSLRQHVVADSDLHVMEPPDLWQRYIDPAFANAAPIGLAEIPRDMRSREWFFTRTRMSRGISASPIGAAWANAGSM